MLDFAACSRWDVCPCCLYIKVCYQLWCKRNHKIWRERIERIFRYNQHRLLWCNLRNAIPKKTQSNNWLCKQLSKNERQDHSQSTNEYKVGEGNPQKIKKSVSMKALKQEEPIIPHKDSKWLSKESDPIGMTRRTVQTAGPRSQWV